MAKKGSHPHFRPITLFFAVMPALTSCGEGLPKTPYRFASARADFEDSVIYSDSLFDAPSTEYNPSLATASLSFAMSCFASSEQRNIDKLTRYVNAQNLLTSLGFQDFFANPDFHKKSSTDTIGLAFAHKKIGEKTLIYTGIRGANYEMEWASNFSIAEPGAAYNPETANPYHYGFYKAAHQLIDELGDYIKTYNIEGDIKLWTSGYSRAGATANVAGGLLDQSIAAKAKPLGDKVSLAKEDLYVYCFEPPMGAPLDAGEDGKLYARSDLYNNIYSHVNFDDPVPLVAMKEVGYTRFGIDRYFPSAISYLHPRAFIDTMRYFYAKNPAYTVRGGDYLIDNFEVKKFQMLKPVADENFVNWTQGLFVRDFVSLLTRFGLGADGMEEMKEAKSNYVAHLQPALRTIFKVIYRNSNFKGSFLDLGLSMINSLSTLLEGDIDALITDLTHNGQSKYIFDDLMVIVSKGAKKLGITFSTSEVKEDLQSLITVLTNFLVKVFGELGYGQMVATWINKTNIKSVASGHYPELNYAATKALDPNYVDHPFPTDNASGKHFTLHMGKGKGTAKVYHDGDLIVEFEDGRIKESDVPARINYDGIAAVLPYVEEGYEIETTDEFFLTLFDYTYFGDYVGVPYEKIGEGRYAIKA